MIPAPAASPRRARTDGSSWSALLSVRVIDQLLEGGRDAAAFGLALLHHDVEHVQFRIDAEISAAAAVPFQLADRTGRRRFCISWIGPHPDAVAITKTVAGKIEIIPPDAGARPDMVRRHQLERRRAEISPAVELAAVEQHLRKTRIVGHGRNQPAAARLPFEVVASVLLRQLQNRII